LRAMSLYEQVSPCGIFLSSFQTHIWKGVPRQCISVIEELSHIFYNPCNKKSSCVKKN
jgi:hypothetical protein